MSRDAFEIPPRNPPKQNTSTATLGYSAGTVGTHLGILLRPLIREHAGWLNMLVSSRNILLVRLLGKRAA
jgi:hypothetical protein